MSFESDISHLENAFAALRAQSSSTNENWVDPVQERFYEQFINPLPKLFSEYINELSKLDKSFETVEQNISNLQE